MTGNAGQQGMDARDMAEWRQNCLRQEVQALKRVLMAGLLCVGINMFFTGCSSLMFDMGEADYSSADSHAASAVPTESDGIKASYDEEDARQSLPDYFELNMDSKFQNLEGERAFQIADGHSDAAGDLESFQIGTLETDGTFIYAYVTCPEGQSESGRIVHCAAAYNYRSGSFQILHQTVFTRTNEDEESFYIQTTDDGGLFVYDNGSGYLYNASGSLTFQTDIETFVRNCFRKAYSVTSVKAVTDGNRRIYVELSVEKEPIDIPDTEDSGNSRSSEEELDEEMEELEQEAEEKLRELVLVYDFQELPSTIDQNNVNFDSQTQQWQAMTEGKEFTEAPDPEADMEAVRARSRDAWGGCFLPGLGDGLVFEWRSGQSFQYADDGYICMFQALPGSYQQFQNLRTNTAVSGLFTPMNGRYYEIFGQTGDFEYYNRERLTRSYIYVWYTEETDSDGNTTETKHTEKRTQYIYRYRTRRTPLSSAFLEGYWLLENENITSVSDCVNGNILCLSNRMISWLKRDGSVSAIGFGLIAGIADEEDGIAGAFQDETDTYITLSGMDTLWIGRQTWQDDNTPQLQRVWEIPYSKLASDYAPGTGSYDRAFDDLNGERLNTDVIYGGSDYYTSDMVMTAELTTDSELADWLRNKGVEVLNPSSGNTSSGFLLTSQAKGLIYFDTTSGKAVKVSSGCWYRTWRQGNRYFSVGFQNGDTSYGGFDVAFAHVYEYDLSELYKENMEETKAQILEEERLQQEEEASRSLEGETEEEQETLKEMLTEWEERRSQEESTEVNLRPYVSEGETFDSAQYEQQESIRQSMQESSDEARINEILDIK